MTLKKGLISIVMPSYNSENYISDAVLSIKKQTYTDWELILVDDGSHDESCNLIQKFCGEDSRIMAIFLEQNKGAANARNIGIQKASGEFLAFLDSDDLWHPQKLELQLNFMKKEGYAFTYTSYDILKENGEPSYKRVTVPQWMDYSQALYKTAISTITVMIDLKQVRDIHMPFLKYGAEDSATWLEILKYIDFAYGLQIELASYRQVSTSLSHSLKARVVRHWILYRKIEKLSLIYSLWNYLKYFNYVLAKRKPY